MADDNDKPMTRSDLEGFVTSFAAKHGSERKALEVLADESLTLRRQKAAWKQRAEKAEARAPEGATVLSADEAKEWAALQAAKRPVADLLKLAEEHGTLTTQLAERDRRDVVRQAAGAAGYRDSVLLDLVQAKGLAVEVRTEEVADAKGQKKSTPVPYVRPAGDDKATPEKLVDYVAKHLADYVPALQVEAGTGSPGGSSYPTQRPTRGTAPAALSEEERVTQKRATGAYSM